MLDNYCDVVSTKNATANSSLLMKLDKVTFREYHIKFEQISLASLAISCLKEKPITWPIQCFEIKYIILRVYCLNHVTMLQLKNFKF